MCAFAFNLEEAAGTLMGRQPRAEAARLQESVRTLSIGILCPGCERRFTPARPNQVHCRPSCRAAAFRRRDETRRGKLFEETDLGRPE